MPATGNAFAYDADMRIRDGSLPLPRSHRMLKKPAGGVLARYCRPQGTQPIHCGLNSARVLPRHHLRQCPWDIFLGDKPQAV